MQMELFVCCDKCCAKNEISSQGSIELWFWGLFSHSNIRSVIVWRHFRARVLRNQPLYFRIGLSEGKRYSSPSVEEKGSH